ncbi:MAG: peptidoglycan editing factor PgeF [Bdellovibrionaceae bacterium]|nr:peptidoglycan editing factor PgeF [Pseudobdellovibrionaceae bacterium]
MTMKTDGATSFLRTESGWIGKIGRALLFFGDKTSSVASLRAQFPSAQLAFLNQVHSDRVHAQVHPSDNARNEFSASDWPEGDAHITTESQVALCVRTADCLPVLITSGKMIAAIHAGWRGVESEIIFKTVLKMRELGANPNDMLAVIGPHIEKNSFEVDRDVAEKLNVVFRKLRFNPAPISYPHPTVATKRLVDLSTLAHAQLVQGGVHEHSVTLLRADTLASPDFHSFRRDRGPGRQISCILLTPSQTSG